MTEVKEYMYCHSVMIYSKIYAKIYFFLAYNCAYGMGSRLKENLTSLETHLSHQNSAIVTVSS